MHAVIHKDFKKFVEERHSPELYQRALEQVGYDVAHFEAEVYHNDAEIDRMVNTTAELLSQSRLDFLTEMGLFGAPGLFEAFKAMIDPEWKTLDLVENIEARMHKYVREEFGAFPPSLKPHRISETELKIDVLSHRKMAGLAKGFILGFGRIYGEAITVDVETSETGYSFTIKKTT
ncbi:MAG: heme NO-binding domain-containing protein [Hyphomicrobiaceae bacterium]